MHDNLDIFDNRERRVGTLTNHGTRPQFYSMTRTVQSEDNDTKSWQDTLTVTIPDEEVSGYNIREFGTLIGCWRPNGRYYLYQVEIIDEDYTQPLPCKKLTCLNLLQYELMGTILESKTYTNADIQTILANILQRTNWNYGEVEYDGGQKSFSISADDNAMTALSNLLTTYGVSIDAYVKQIKPGVFKKLVDCKAKMGEMTYKVLDFHTGMTGFTRQVSREPGTFATRIYPRTSDGKGIASVNNGIDYVEDVEANDKYNANDYGKFVEMTLSNDTGIQNLYALKNWAQTQLKKYSTPPYIYTFNTSFVNEVPSLGDGYYFKNFDIDPPLIVEGYVTSITDSYTNPENNAITCGDFRTIEYSIPRIVTELREQLQANDVNVEAVRKAMADINSITVVTSTPDGKDFNNTSETKRAIFSAYEGLHNISAYLQPQGAEWRFMKDGSVDYGFVKKATYSDIGMWNGYVNNDYIVEQSELDIDVNKISVIGSYTPWVSSGNEPLHVGQCIIKNSDGTYFTSHGVGNSTDDTIYCWRDSSFKVKQSMTVKYGGHGTNFGAYYDDTKKAYFLIIFHHDTSKNSSGKWSKYYASIGQFKAGTYEATDESTFRRLYSSNHYLTAAGNGDSIGWKVGNTVSIRALYQGSDPYDQTKRTLAPDNASYSIDLTKVGLNTSKDYYQSFSVHNDWVFWCSGHTGQNATNKIAAVNAVHGGRCFRYTIDFDNFGFKYTTGINEIESITVTPDNQLLIQVINYMKTSGDGNECVEYILQTPLIIRQDPAIEYPDEYDTQDE